MPLVAFVAAAIIMRFLHYLWPWQQYISSEYCQLVLSLSLALGLLCYYITLLSFSWRDAIMTEHQQAFSLAQRYLVAIRCCGIFCAACVGASYFAWSAQLQAEKWQQLPEQKRDIEMRVQIHSLVSQQGRRQQFVAKVIDSELPLYQSAYLRISAYQLPDEQQSPSLLNAPQQLAAGQRWHIVLRAKPIRGVKNQAGFNYQRYAFSQRWLAQAYIREWRAYLGDCQQWRDLVMETTACINQARQRLKNQLQALLPIEDYAWFAALALGDKTAMSQQQFSLLQHTATVHLFVVSGLHMGLLAAWVFALAYLVRLLAVLLAVPLPWICLSQQLPLVPLAVLIISAFYASLVGWSVPVQRAYIMLCCLLAGQLLQLNIAIVWRLLMAACISILIEPLALLQLGFYLSYLAVAMLCMLASLYPKRLRQCYACQSVRARWSRRCLDAGLAYLCLQAIMMFCLWPLTASSQGVLNLLALFYNGLLIPLISLLVLPAVLAVTACLLLANATQIASWIGYAEQLMTSVALQLRLLMQQLQHVLQWQTEQPWLQPSLIDIAQLNSAFFLLVLWLVLQLMFRHIMPYRVSMMANLCILVMLPVLYSQTANQKHTSKPPLQLDMLDVGQGLALLLQTPRHAMVYDTGAAWPGGSMAKWVLAPVLAAQGLMQLDRVMISHLDNDHAGGTADLLKHIAVKQLVSSEPNLLSAELSRPVQRCQQGQSWYWDAVKFQVLWPPAVNISKRNNRSCVLLISVAGQHILLTGDIDQRTELAILAQPALQAALPLTALVLAHHGSKHSSSYSFLQRTRPQMALVSAGYLNRFQHPDQRVLQRLEDLSIKLYSTAVDGQVTLRFSADKRFQLYTQQQAMAAQSWY
ncbi:MAG: DNA internalization-related competence protein ComEC/Rec2 [Pseudomonadales bacterium]|nr:DNA internalization-related competence protein ComEC/Rec2 [Pseudomonadales bacterium]